MLQPGSFGNCHNERSSYLSYSFISLSVNSLGTAGVIFKNKTQSSNVNLPILWKTACGELSEVCSRHSPPPFPPNFTLELCEIGVKCYGTLF